MIDAIRLSGVRPMVFAGDEFRERIEQSEVWCSDVTFEKGRTYLVSAESGAGKSSLCCYIYGLRRDFEGLIEMDGRDVRCFTIEDWCELRMRHLAYLPQELKLFPELTVVENIGIKNALTGYASDDWIEAALERLGIADKAGSLAGQLSVGQQQRVAIVRALCQPFDFLLIDEPVSHLDARNNEAMASFIVEEASLRGAGIVATSVGNDIDLKFDEVFKL